MYLAQLSDLLVEDFRGDFGQHHPPEYNEPGTWMPKVLDALRKHVFNGTCEFIPYYRPGVAIVNTTFTHTGYDASANLASVRFIHEDEFLHWGKHEDNNMKKRRRTDTGPKKLMDAPG